MDTEDTLSRPASVGDTEAFAAACLDIITDSRPLDDFDYSMIRSIMETPISGTRQTLAVAAMAQSIARRLFPENIVRDRGSQDFALRCLVHDFLGKVVKALEIAETESCDDMLPPIAPPPAPLIN